MPTMCGRAYIGQTGRCVNGRARENDLSVRPSLSGNLTVHCDRCPCSLYSMELKFREGTKNKQKEESSRLLKSR